MDSDEREAGRGKQIAVLDFSALAASGHYEHAQVEELARRRLIRWRDHKFYEQEAALRMYGLADPWPACALR